LGSRFSLEAILSLTDNLTKPYLSSTRRLINSNKNLTRSFARINKGVNKTIGLVGTGLKRAAMAGLLTLTIATGAAAREFIALDDSITAAGAKFSDIDSTATDFRDRLKELSTAAREVGAVTEFSAVDAAGALDKFAMSGINAVQSMALLRGTTDLATAAGTDLTTAVDIATDSLGAFGKMTNDTVQLEKNLTKVSDQMAKTTVTANTSLTELFDAVGKGAATFTNAGQSMATFNSFAGVLAKSTKKGGEAGTALRNVMLRLAKPTGEAADVIKSMGVRLADSKGDFRDVVDIIADFEKGLKGMGSQQKTAALSTVFGAKTVDAFNLLLAEGSVKLRTYRTEIENSAGASRKMADAIRTSLGNRIKVLRSSLTELGLQFVEAFEMQGRNALDILIQKVQEFDIQPVVEGVTQAFIILKKLFNFLSENTGVIKAVIAGFIAWKVAAIGLSIALAATPVGAIIAGISALIAAIILVIEKWKEFKKTFSGATFGDFINPFSKERTQQAESEGRIGLGSSTGPRLTTEQVLQERARLREETRQRNDVFLHAPSGFGVSATAGGAPG